ncbi:MAG: asparagine synthase C-terminal domain-containing protein [Dysgonamonadaceae bacterium]|jgi:asparagine synthase (glutamine-hydrolysing)|nr:asparagine synthase C-terminal domain-containing protein [Dysgonamonadaceae bacterium]
MITIKLTDNKVFGWCQADSVSAKGYCFAPDGKLYRGADLCSYFTDAATVDDFRRKLLSANGLFSVVIQRNNSTWIGVDRFRHFPLFYRQKENKLIVADAVDDLFDDDEPKELDAESCTVFSGLSYVLGNKTLIKNVFQVQAGEYLIYDGHPVTTSYYYRYFAPIRDMGFEEAGQQLKTILKRIGERMSRLIGDRPVLLSLSGGLDSRLIAYLLKINKIKNVTCFTYGIEEGNPEWQRSKAVADKLGFQWVFVDYSKINSPNFYEKKQFLDYAHYAAQYVVKFGITPYFAADKFINEMKISPDTVLLLGYGGDYFSGKHLKPYMRHYRSVSAIAKDLQYAHCDLVKLNIRERRLIRRIIKNSLDAKVFPLFANVEDWIVKRRYPNIYSGKLWEFHEIETQTPLCDTELMDFFEALPFEYRLNQKLYKTVLSELFEKFDIHFSTPEVPHQNVTLQRIKIYIKRILPFLRLRHDLFCLDYFDMKRFLKPVLAEVYKKEPKKKILSYNGIISEWYLMKLKKRLKTS